MNKTIAFLLFALLLMFASLSHAGVTPIDLSTFYADPTAVVSADGLSAFLGEDTERITVLLSNDPGLGDPGIAIPTGLSSLSFNYNFTLGTDNTDNFYAKVFDGTTGTIIKDFLIETSGSGPVTWDLTGLGSGTSILGLEFQLNSNDTAFDSTVNISNVQMETVPIPGALVLLASGIAGLAGLRKRPC